MVNTVVKTALKTLLGVIIALLIAFAIASLGFPASMASLFEDWGNYSLATGYASLRYSYTGDVEDLARCFQDGVLSGNDSDIIRFGDQLIANEKFGELCEKKNEQLAAITEHPLDYKQTVYGSVACAKYRQNNKNGAFETAKAAMENETEFASNNALAQLSLQVIVAKDKETASSLLDEIKRYENDDKYYQAVYSQLEIVANNQ